MSKPKESKAERLARKGANAVQLTALVDDLEGSFHARALVPSTTRDHDAVYEHWREFAASIGISADILPGQQPPSEGLLTCIYLPQEQR